ncbi:sensor domain-containing protein [Streptomyces aureocirculatus]|uniref:sensor domain-containing protein n=1 Tax=Streptomyces aureocirculatus TaxID=67275 RepID=UPI000D14089C|nr:sensor domain-containing protein [Streptomyces aureocirculatus]
MDKGRRGRRRAVTGGTVLVAVAVAAVAALGAPSALAGEVSAGGGAGARAEQPGFLEPSDMPPDPFSAWYGTGGPAAGMPGSPRCVDGSFPFPENDLWSASYSTPETASAEQVVVVLPSEAEAAAFAERVDAALARCEATLEAEYPDRDVTYWDHGRVDVEEGAHVHGAGYQGFHGYQNILSSVGRDGAVVTIVTWESNWGSPPVAAFKETTRTAVNKLY